MLVVILKEVEDGGVGDGRGWGVSIALSCYSEVEENFVQIEKSEVNSPLSSNFDESIQMMDNQFMKIPSENRFWRMKNRFLNEP